MSEAFKRKLAAYEKGELSGEELEAFEKELDKLEAYQSFLQADDQQDSSRRISTEYEKNQMKILRRGKWRARFQTALTALSLFIIFTILSGIFSSLYYTLGTPDRVEVLRNVIDYTMTVTDPYGHLGGTSTGTSLYFGLEATRDISKKVGHERIIVGDMTVNFRLSQLTNAEKRYAGTTTQDRPAFTYPGRGSRGMSDWEQLDKLPEGTVVSAYVSFSELLSTKEVIDLFEGENMDLLWLAVDTGKEFGGADDGIIFDPIGFPSSPIWHDDDFIVTDRQEETSGWFGSKIVTESAMSPAFESGDYGVLQQQFMKTLAFLEKHERKAERLVFGKLQLAERIAYLEENGFYHYGAVITGPTKEILQLQSEPWMAALEVDEVAFWNWRAD